MTAGRPGGVCLRGTLVLLALSCLSSGLRAGISDLAIGDPARRERSTEVSLDSIVDTRGNEIITPGELVERLADVDIVFVGENHTSREYHRVQRLLIEELDRGGRDVLLGLEMFPSREQRHLDRWSRGHLTEEGFLELSQWYKNWGYHWEYYRDIFVFARRKHLPLFAVNLDPDLVSAVREKGFDGLSEEESAQLPPEIDVDDDEHRRLFQAFFAEEEDEENEEEEKEEGSQAEEDDDKGGESFHSSLSEEAWAGLFRAQCTWDAGMAYHAVQAWRKHAQGVRSPSAGRPIMVVLAGVGHVAYGLGIERQARQFFDGKTASVLPVTLSRKGKGKEEWRDRVQASFGNFLWGVAEEPWPAYPSLGVATRKIEGEDTLHVLFVVPDTPAQHAGLQAGDALLEIDGVALTGRAALNRAVAEKSWGQSSSLLLRRAGELLTRTVHFRREAVALGDDE